MFCIPGWRFGVNNNQKGILIMMNLGDKSMMLLAAFALGVCPCAALATDPEPLSVDSVAIADLDGDSQPEMLGSNLLSVKILAP
jgi:hypothetical protein